MKGSTLERIYRSWGNFLIVILTIGTGCSKQPQSVEELVPEVVMDSANQDKFFSVTATGNQPMLDDLEDGDLTGLQLEGRNWSWSQFDDTSDGIQYLTIRQEKDAPGSGKNVLYLKGGNWKIKGAGLSANLVSKTTPRHLGYYNASVYSGVQFWIKTVGLKSIKVLASTPETTSVYEGGICLKNCPGHFSFALDVGETWQQVSIPFESFTLTSGKHSLPLDPSRIKGIHFSIETLEDYELWLDDLSFYQ